MEAAPGGPQMPEFDAVGAGRPQLWVLQGQAIELQGEPPRGEAAPFKLLLSCLGRTEVAQDGRQTTLAAGEFTLIDGARRFELSATARFTHVLVALPRAAVVGRHRGIERRTALAHGSGAGEQLVRSLAEAWARAAPHFTPAATAHAATALIDLLGVLNTSHGFDAAASLRQRAEALVELHLPDTSADLLALQLGVSRRHLDAVFSSAGTTASAYLWKRRLQVAACRLREPAAPGVTAVAHAIGFKDASHFARLFRRRYGLSPSQWRVAPATAAAG